MQGVNLLPELACDRVMPLWVARVRGVDPALGIRRFTWVEATGRGKKAYRVWWLAYSPGELALAPHVVRHGLLLSVARWFLGASPGEWDALSVREVRQGASRRTIRGREWARERVRLGHGLPPRPDAEWWRLREDDGVRWYGSRPWAVEVDTGKLAFPERYADRVRRWMVDYAGVVVVTPSPVRAQAWRDWFTAMTLRYPGWAGEWEVYGVDRWWEEGAVWRSY